MKLVELRMVQFCFLYFVREWKKENIKIKTWLSVNSNKIREGQEPSVLEQPYYSSTKN